MKKRKTGFLIMAGMMFSLCLPSSLQALTVTVKSGDTLWSLSRKYDVSVEEIKRLNGMNSSLLVIGKELKLSDDVKPTEGATYTVQHGDYLYAIGQKFGVSYKKIAEWNNLSSYVLYSGQVLIVSEPTATPPLPENNATPLTYTVKPGDTLYKIARDYNLSVEAVRNMNELKHTVIYPGQVLKVKMALFSSPVEGTTTSGYGPRNGSFHYGIDFPGTGLISIKAALEGVVSKSYYSSSYGHVVFILHTAGGQEYETVYAHMRDRAVKVGDFVKTGAHLGYMGNTGESRGQHLHFEIHKGRWNAKKTNAVNPVDYLP
jgi:murein DD-endopeptidase MepM/ murein hydrolase activator NlpD